MFNPHLLTAAEQSDQSSPAGPDAQSAAAQPDMVLPNVQMMSFRPMTMPTMSPTFLPGLPRPPMYFSPFTSQLSMSQSGMSNPFGGMPYHFGQPPGVQPVNLYSGGVPVQVGGPSSEGHSERQRPDTHGRSGNNLPSSQTSYQASLQKQQKGGSHSGTHQGPKDASGQRNNQKPPGLPNQFAKLSSHNRHEDKGNPHNRRGGEGRDSWSGGYKPKTNSNNPYLCDETEHSSSKQRSDSRSLQTLGKREPYQDDRHKPRKEQQKFDISDEEEEVDDEVVFAEKQQLPGEEKLALAGLTTPELTTPEEIRKWVQARRANYPTKAKVAQKERELFEQGESGKLKESELSRLEVRLRKKLMILDYDPVQERNRQRDKRKLLERIGRKTKLRRTGKNGGNGPNQKPEGDVPAGNKTPQQDVRQQKEKPSWSENKQPMPSSDFHGGASSTTAEDIKDDVSDTNPEHALRYSISHSSDSESSEDERPPVEVSMKKDLSVLAAMGVKEEELINESATKKILPTEQPSQFKKPPTKPALTPESIISHSITRKQEDSSAIENFMKAKTSTRNFKRQQGSLLSNLLLEDVYKERDTILQTLRYIVKKNFFQQQSGTQ